APGPSAPAAPRAARDPDVEGLVSSVGATAGGDLEEAVAVRVADLVGYQDLGYARRYAEVVARARAADESLGRGDGDFSRSVAVELHRLMAYKDEYEVARLHLAEGARQEVEREVGLGARVTYHLAPEWLASPGGARKRAWRTGARPALRVLRAARRLRGTHLDPFGATRLRREERRVRDEYVATVTGLSEGLADEDYATAVELAGLASLVRGFGEVKTASLERYAQRRALVGAADVPRRGPRLD
ncbi:MAG: hypothetical protein KGJ36_03820, partial [Acidobacteriota bacterium]|nr:hypothetical protein [Acidobacteriota bacterium]